MTTSTNSVRSKAK